MNRWPVKDLAAQRDEYAPGMSTQMQRVLSILTGLREKSGESQTDLADALGVRQPTVSSWERQKHAPPLFQLVEWAERYNHNIHVIPSVDAKQGRLQDLLVCAAALDDDQLSDLLVLARLVGVVREDVRRAAVELVKSVTSSDASAATKSSKAS